MHKCDAGCKMQRKEEDFRWGRGAAPENLRCPGFIVDSEPGCPRDTGVIKVSRCPQGLGRVLV